MDAVIAGLRAVVAPKREPAHVVEAIPPNLIATVCRSSGGGE
jgi:hypothetical protein